VNDPVFSESDRQTDKDGIGKERPLAAKNYARFVGSVEMKIIHRQI
jgi:hypothetical protein